MDIRSFAELLGEQVRTRRRALGISQAQLAERSGVSKRLIVSLESGKATQISLGRLLAVLENLSLRLELATPEERPKSAESPVSKAEPLDADTYLQAYRERLSASTQALLARAASAKEDNPWQQSD